MQMTVNKFRYSYLHIAIYYLIIMVFPIGVVLLSWGKAFDFDIYLGLGGDAYGTAAVVKSIQENGLLGLFYNPRWAAPEAAILVDYPFMGYIMAFMIWIISLFTKSIPRIMYIYILLTYAFSAVFMGVLLRKLHINRLITFLIAELFSLAPYHFYRTGHLTLINYMVVPIAIYLSLYILNFFQDEKKLAVWSCSVALGLGYGYYYSFGLIIMFIALLMNIVRNRDVRLFLNRLCPFAIVLITVLITLLPQIIYSVINGKNIEIGRQFYEQELYGLKIINLVLPITYSRIGNIKSVTEQYLNVAPLVTENYLAGLGLIASIGFIITCILFIFSFFDKKKTNDGIWVVIDYISFSIISLILFCSIGGFGELFNWFITPQIRCHNRASIFIMAFSLIILSIVLDKLSNYTYIIIPLICIIMVIGIMDQVRFIGDDWQSDVRIRQDEYTIYFDRVEKELERGSMVYELPFMVFPENGAIYNMADYQPFCGYLFTDELRWSYGGLIGRNSRARELYVDNGMSMEFLEGIKGAGFKAVLIDLDGYEDDGTEILNFYNGLGIEPIVSNDGKLFTYDLSKYNQEN